MKQITEREVVLTFSEAIASRLFDAKLDEGLNIPDAVEAVKAQFERWEIHLGADFLEWLGQ